MSTQIRFSNFRYSTPVTKFECTVDASDHSQPDNIYFEFSEAVDKLSNDSIAVMLSTLCGTKYDEIYMDLSVKEHTARIIEDFTKATVSFLSVRAEGTSHVDAHGGYMLNFSGGFDSLAAFCIMPPETKLIAIQFDGPFERESDFFKQFNPYTLRTNFRTLHYDRSHWTFMGAAMLLFAETLGCENGIFGSILEATEWNFISTPASSARMNVAPFTGIGLKSPPLLQGLSEIGTAMIIARHHPELVAPALRSLAAPGSEKLYRKYLMAKAVSETYNYNLDLPPCQPTQEKFAVNWGKSLACDLLSLYMMKNFGFDTASVMVKGIPPEAVALSKSLTLKFFEHFNTNFLAAVPSDLAAYAIDKMLEAHILPYNERDWMEFTQVKNYFSANYPRLAQ